MGMLMDYTPYRQAVEERLAQMRTGNAHQAQVQDLRLVKGEYWETRKVPANPHHFTRERFEDYLRAERFPLNTLVDRVRVHTDRVRDALLSGQFVPQDVMQDAVGVEALEKAVSHVLAEAEGSFRLDQQAAAVRDFELAIGYTVANGKHAAVLKRTMLAAARAQRSTLGIQYGANKWVTGGYKRVDMEGHPRGILVALRSGAGNAQWLEFRDTGWHPGSLYGEVHRITYVEADGVFSKAVEAGEISTAEAQSVMGHRWQPFVRVSMVASA